MKKIIYIVLAVLILAWGGFLVLREPTEVEPNGEEEPEVELSVDFLPGEVDGQEREAQEIVVSGEEEGELFSLTISEFRQWARDNWDVFEEPPTVAMQEIDPGNFGHFGRAAEVSPDGTRLVFTVSDYAVATSTSFTVVVDLETEEMNFINETNTGTVSDYLWKEDSQLVAYSLNTARAAGDHLTVDNTEERRKNFTVSEEDLLEVIDPDEQEVEEGQFMPRFRGLNWEDGRLEFTTSSLEEAGVPADQVDEEGLRWRVDVDGENLELLE